MKWTNPGHQLDTLGAQYLNVKNLYIYGIDERAQKAFDLLQWLGVADEFDITFVQDITVFNRESTHIFCGKRIIPFQTTLCEALRSTSKESAVALPWIAQTNEREILEKIGVTNIFYLTQSHNRRDNFVQNFVCVWLMYKHGKLLSHWTNFLTTSKCNLNCKYCLNFKEFIKNPQDVSFEEFKEHFDVIFSKFDYLYSLHFTGGEPLVAKELPRLLSYLNEHYKNRIFEFFIITNGTIVPSEDTISAVKALNGTFLIDDYSASEPTTKVNEIRSALDVHHVNYKVNAAENWFDLDMDHTDNSGLSEDELTSYKDNCNSYLHEFGEKRIYACCYQEYAARVGLTTITSDDYIEIANTPKMEILEFRQGYTRKGYVEFCKHCRGIGGNAKLVAPAIQIPRALSEPTYSQMDTKGNKLVSICVPVYNTDRYLARCVNSLLVQTYHNLEIILVDDGSTDHCGTICDTFATVDPRVVALHKINGGEASARNAALHAATGKYIMFIDSDDEYLPNAVQLMLDAIETENVDLVIGGYLERRGEIEHFATGHIRKYSIAELARDYLTSSCQYGMPYIATTVNAKMFRRSLISSYQICFDERFVVGNDSVFMCAYLEHAKAIYDVLAAIYVYYKFPSSERVQGMGWYYPDAFFLFAYVADRMIKLAQPDETEYRQLITKQYKDLLYGLLNGCANIDHFENGLLPYLTSFCREIDLLQIGAKLDLAEEYIEKEEGALPIRLISYLIVNEHYSELYALLQTLVKTRKVIPYKGKQVRQMIRLRDNVQNPSPTNPRSSVPSSESRDLSRFHFADDRLLMEQVNGLILTIISSQRSMNASDSRAAEAQARADNAEVRAAEAQARADNAEVRAAEAQARADNAEARTVETQTIVNTYKAELDHLLQSKSWRFTEPLRVFMRHLRGQ